MEALQIKDELGDRNGVAVALHVLASIALAEGHYQDACLQTIQALRIDQELGNRHSVAASLKMLGEVALNLRQPREAIVLTSLAVLILREIGHADLRGFLGSLMLMVAMEHYEDQIDEIIRK